MNRLKHALPRDLRFRINRSAIDTPGMGDAYIVARSSLRRMRARPDSQVVLEGFPRSGNTYGYIILKFVLGDGNEVRGHTHSARNVIRATRLGIPTILVVREPRAAVSSLVQLAPSLSLHTAFDGYAKFHQKLMPHVNRILISEFDDVINDFGSVIDAANARFHSAIPRYDKSEENERIIRDRIDHNGRLRANGLISEMTVARPSGSRRPPEQVLEHLDANTIASLHRAEQAYADIRSGGHTNM